MTCRYMRSAIACMLMLMLGSAAVAHAEATARDRLTGLRGRPAPVCRVKSGALIPFVAKPPAFFAGNGPVATYATASGGAAMYFDRDAFAVYPRAYRLFLVYAECERINGASTEPEEGNRPHGVSPAQCGATQRLQREQGFRFEEVRVVVTAMKERGEQQVSEAFLTRMLVCGTKIMFHERR